jgi:hypothetical protein
MSGSQKLLQAVVNEQTSAINIKLSDAYDAIDASSIEWVSPLATDSYAEYWDSRFLQKLGIEVNLKVPLSDFWPSGGPHWDALAKTKSGQVIIVEAKANIEEFVSSPSGAKAEASIDKISQSMDDLRSFLKIRKSADMQGPFYQYFNRLAHLYYLREINGIDAYLAFIYFTGAEVAGKLCPSSIEEWKSAIRTVDVYFGIKKLNFMNYVADVFIDAAKLTYAHSRW